MHCGWLCVCVFGFISILTASDAASLQEKPEPRMMKLKEGGDGETAKKDNEEVEKPPVQESTPPVTYLTTLFPEEYKNMTLEEIVNSFNSTDTDSEPSKPKEAALDKMKAILNKIVEMIEKYSKPAQEVLNKIGTATADIIKSIVDVFKKSSKKSTDT